MIWQIVPGVYIFNLSVSYQIHMVQVIWFGDSVYDVLHSGQYVPPYLPRRIHIRDKNQEQIHEYYNMNSYMI